MTRRFEDSLATLDAIRADPHAAGAAAEMRRALTGRSNLLAARAAEIIAEWELSDFAEDVAHAFDWFMADAVGREAARRDPTCAAKIALAEALVRLDHDDADRFARGMAHVQPEPVWGGTEDTAARLRAICALGLARANPDDVLLRLAALLADPETDARVGAVRAIAGASRPGAAPLLWYKTLAGDAEGAPLFECFMALLSLEPERALALVGGHLQSDNPALAEAAALALGDSRLSSAAPVLRQAWEAVDNPALRRTLLGALGRLHDDEALSFLLDLLAAGPTHDARDALAALAVYRGDRRRWRKIERVLAQRNDLD